MTIREHRDKAYPGGYLAVTTREDSAMANSDNQAHDGHVACEVCLAEVPTDEAHSPEATEYVVYFCGLDCFDQWSRKEEGSHSATGE